LYIPLKLNYTNLKTGFKLKGFDFEVCSWAKIRRFYRADEESQNLKENAV
jgi:hypothetical protein